MLVYAVFMISCFMTCVVLGMGGKEISNRPWPERIHNLVKEVHIPVHVG